VEVVYECAEEQASVDPSLIAGIDIGLNNLAAVTANKSGIVPRVVNGRPIKSIQVVTTEESHTSKCSFLDLERIGHHEHSMGRRIKRGMFRSQFGTLINADVNGSYNIIRKVASDAFERGCRGWAVHPVPLAIGS